MNAFFALLLVGTLHTSLSAETPSHTTSSYVANEKMAVWVSSDQKVHLVLGPESTSAEVRLVDKHGEYLQQRIKVHDRAVRQNYDLSALPNGTYELQVRTGQQTIRKAIVISQPAAQRVVTIS
ncbi:hypothetical protein HNV11_13520 [Spirosoma taeanense]|uniref:T9SS type A sorting domain-containing protein n=1 Tax=Spirosoma taeanense TaxID=2735870 RepID=A0A6M5YAQ7_9BACT|nr:hypothetical protein [Spirosoma taeanense]QJW90321.1 hypothetical protein HNV11_13520 [Spirosoma taeanense]